MAEFTELRIKHGSGVVSAIEQRGAGRLAWIDVDRPNVIAIRRRFYAETASRRIVAGDITNSQFFTSLSFRKTLESSTTSSRGSSGGCAPLRRTVRDSLGAF